ncbi:hypothetical protein GQ457_09G011750 [Hibiscus cannabinus]
MSPRTLSCLQEITLQNMGIGILRSSGNYAACRQRLVNLLRYCSKNSLLDQRVQVHTVSLKTRFGFDLMLSDDLIDMYAKCGVVDNAPLVFDIMFERNMISWTALMCGDHLQIGNGPVVGNSIVDLYLICGRINEAATMFTALSIILEKRG